MPSIFITISIPSYHRSFIIILFFKVKLILYYLSFIIYIPKGSYYYISYKR